MKANELEEFSAKELDRLSREREDAIKAKGGLPYLGSLPVGESKLILQAKIPTDNPDRDGRPRKDHPVERPKGSGQVGTDRESEILISGPRGSRSSKGIPEAVCRQEDSGRRRFRLDREHQIAPLPRPARVPRQSAHHAPRHTDRRRANRHALHGQGRVEPEIREPGNRKNNTGFDPYFISEQK